MLPSPPGMPPLNVVGRLARRERVHTTQAAAALQHAENVKIRFGLGKASRP